VSSGSECRPQPLFISADAMLPEFFITRAAARGTINTKVKLEFAMSSKSIEKILGQILVTFLVNSCNVPCEFPRRFLPNSYVSIRVVLL
jgi:hypothetical protein